MLVLSRRSDETIVFPSLGIEISVVRINQSQVRLGVKAPADVKILRGELDTGTTISAPLQSFTKNRTPEDSVDSVRKTISLANQKLKNVEASLKRNNSLASQSSTASLISELEELDEQLSAILDRGAELTAHPSSKRALLVDDNKNETKLLAGYLRLKKFEVDTTFDGAEAMQYLNGHDIPDIMVLDMNMPNFDGRWTVNMIRANSKYDGLRIFAVSGTDPRECGVEVGPAGVDLWLQKPLNPERLLLEISNLDRPGYRTSKAKIVCETRNQMMQPR